MENTQNKQKASVVYLTKDISPEGLVNIYKALGVPAKGRVAIKMSTGEGSNPNYLKPELIKNLVFEVDGTIVECNTAYGNGPGDEQDNRDSSATGLATSKTTATRRPTTGRSLSGTVSRPRSRSTSWTRRARCASPCRIRRTSNMTSWAATWPNTTS